MIDTEDPKQTIEGPGGLSLELDAGQIFPDDPGQGTPALCVLGKNTGTFWCSHDNAEVDDVALSDRQSEWLADLYDEVDAWLTFHTRRIKANG